MEESIQQHLKYQKKRIFPSPSLVTTDIIISQAAYVSPESRMYQNSYNIL